jgi:hypothetical protein
MIEKSAFGSIQIEGKNYTTDIIIYPDGRVSDNWWRRHGHRLRLEDIENLILAKPDVIVIGTGVYGRMLPDSGLEKSVKDQGIELILAPTGDAVSRFNQLQSSRKTGAGFHLTC